MHNRLRLLRLFTALLYFGPLLAGLMGHGWVMVAAFTLIFLLWSAILRPELWPHGEGDLERSDAIVALAALIASQVLLVIFCFAIGRGIGGVLGLKPALPAYLPLALSFLAVPLCRMVWRSQAAIAAPAFDWVLHGSDGAGEAAAHLARAGLAEIAAMPDHVSEEALQTRLTAIGAELDPVMIRLALQHAVTDGRLSRATRKALIIHATDPANSDLLAESRYPAMAFVAAGVDCELLGLFARRCTRLLEDEPDLVADCPSAIMVSKTAEECPDPVVVGQLNRLIGFLA